MLPPPRFVQIILALLLALTQVPGTGGVQAQTTLQTSLDGADWQTDPKRLADSTAVVDRLTEWLDKQRAGAHWEASVDTLYRHDETTYRARLHLGPQYTWEELREPADETQRTWLKRAGYRAGGFEGRNLRPAAWSALRDSTVSRAARAGYPFAQVGLDSIEWSAPGRLRAKIDVAPGPLIRIGEVRYSESARVREVFLQRYLGLTPGSPYNSRRIGRITSRLNQLPYLRANGSPRITFEDSLAFLDLPLQKRSASRFDFVIGVLPGSGTDGGILFTGELNGELYNGFGQGERILARFEQLRPQTQELALVVDYPYVLGLPFGVEGELDLYRRDSSFLNLNWRVAATYLREGNDRLSFFWENRRTIVPGRSAPELSPTGELPDTLGVSRSFFGIQAARTRTDRRFQPPPGLRRFPEYRGRHPHSARRPGRRQHGTPTGANSNWRGRRTCTCRPFPVPSCTPVCGAEPCSMGGRCYPTSNTGWVGPGCCGASTSSSSLPGTTSWLPPNYAYYWVAMPSSTPS